MTVISSSVNERETTRLEKVIVSLVIGRAYDLFYSVGMPAPSVERLHFL